MKRTTGGRVGYESVNVRVSRKDPSSKGVSASRQRSSVEERSTHHGISVWEQAPSTSPWEKVMFNLSSIHLAS